MNIAILKTGLFPDAETVTKALEQLADSAPAVIHDTTDTNLTDAHWDRILDDLLIADRVIVI
ncbi:MAG TPA: hypothetical protein DDY14_08110 [Chromatiaceae bacterium]|jgi:hypothetical protein|nr:MAG: hypothetical protein N838_06560 [Thiohalocapsa sp. PB-PSB1]QQO53589.1 MAG: hypothetical protein N838_09725 [Thiohalocapsa sp. PB-PSB1]HBG95276.1 hypothetical protein [Chromatiaceae bacterium]HCS92348.1 hypothetical protein [Chromatiaceae bacterium]